MVHSVSLASSCNTSKDDTQARLARVSACWLYARGLQVHGATTASRGSMWPNLHMAWMASVATATLCVYSAFLVFSSEFNHPMTTWLYPLSSNKKGEAGRKS